jgi:hypothetical protein
MARALTFALAGQTYAGSPTKVDRRKLYGWSETVALDDDGRECRLAAVDASGTLVIPKGGIGLGLLTADQRWVDRADLTAVTAEGSTAQPVPSSYDGPIPLTAIATAEDILDHTITALYQLTDVDAALASALGQDIYTFPYAFRAGYTDSPAFLLASGEAVFLLVGAKQTYDFLSLEQFAAVTESEADDGAEDDADLDFSMF